MNTIVCGINEELPELLIVLCLMSGFMVMSFIGIFILFQSNYLF
jgi:hypothetical protein